MRFFFGDVETTGLRKPAKIVELCVVETDDQFNVLNTWESRIDPEAPIEPGASGVHGLTNAMLVDEPTIEQFMEMHGYPLRTDGVLIAHNVAYDREFLGPHFESYETICTLKAEIAGSCVGFKFCKARILSNDFSATLNDASTSRNSSATLSSATVVKLNTPLR